MPSGLRRVQESGQSHFITFSCDRRQPLFSTSDLFDEFVRTIEDMRRRFQMRMYGYVVMPEHVHLLVSEPPDAALAEAIHYLKLSFAKRARSARPPESGSFWQKRYYDRNVRNYREFTVKLRYLHRNPVRRGLIGDAADWKWSSFRHYVFRERAWWKLSRSGQRGTGNDRKKRGCSSAQVSVHRTDANLGHPAL
jgi:putative transposase